MNRRTDKGAIKCPHCGADCFASAQRCWLCYTDFGQSSEIVMAELVAEPPRQSISEAFFAVLTVLALGTVIVVGIGVAMQESRTGMVYFVLGLIPLTICAVRLQDKEARQGNMTWAQRFRTLMATTAVALVTTAVASGIICVLVSSSVIYFLRVCMNRPW